MQSITIPSIRKSVMMRIKWLIPFADRPDISGELIDSGQNRAWGKSICMHGLIKSDLIASKLQLPDPQKEL